MSGSEDISRRFYASLGADGLAQRTRGDWDASIVAALAELIPTGARVLDVGCGYGRISLPLARLGYSVKGYDLAPNLIEAARASASSEGLDIEWQVGSMTRLPHPDERFDAVICLWSAFHELLEESEQTMAIKEMWRVLASGGFAFVEGPRFEAATSEQIRSRTRRGNDNRIEWDLVDGIENPHYLHDKPSFAKICDLAGVGTFTVSERDWGGRQRLTLRLDKP